MTHVLIVEDDIDIAEGLADTLEPLGYTLDFAYRGDHALQLLEQNRYDLLILDINLPGQDGLSVCQSLKLSSPLACVPVLMITANNSEQDKLDGFSHGAWDYLTKPFSMAELAARVSVLSQRSQLPGDERKFGDLSVNANKTAAFVNGNPLPIHSTGIALLNELIRQAPQPASSAQLCRALWPDETPQSDPLRANIYRVRKALQTAGSNVSVATVKGIGYQLEQVS
ncbi:response regulator transcription factor [Aestuariibacter halophilus]|uniref:Response regulator transcription factor n=1 Tax=Fluctibacter halophilus TaxID=226011 RepID=A0ABS8G909_9ALTE|nr:response regulator transcription factor [Aestuariibacter halophilus]MCC2616581.1 response regulator transcription factor [Aestuariibacter halophilus]